MIKSIHIVNYTAFQDVELSFGKRLNVILGENGTGKTHLLNLLYSLHLDWRHEIPVKKVWGIRDTDCLLRNKKKEMTASMETDEGTLEISVNKEYTLIPKFESKTPILYLQSGFDMTAENFLLELDAKGPEESLLSTGELRLRETRKVLERLLRNSVLLFDCPETWLDPKGIRKMVQMLKDLNGVQIFVTTNSLFMMRELELELYKMKGVRWFNLLGKKGVEQGDDPYDIGDISLVDENIRQCDRYMALD